MCKFGCAKSNLPEVIYQYFNLPAYLSTFISTHPPTHPPTHLPTCLPTYLHPYLHIDFYGNESAKGPAAANRTSASPGQSFRFQVSGLGFRQRLALNQARTPPPPLSTGKGEPTGAGGRGFEPWRGGVGGVSPRHTEPHTCATTRNGPKHATTKNGQTTSQIKWAPGEHGPRMARAPCARSQWSSKLAAHPRTHAPTHPPTYLPSYLRTYVRTYVRTYLPNYLPTCVPSYSQPSRPSGPSRPRQRGQTCREW